MTVVTLSPEMLMPSSVVRFSSLLGSSSEMLTVERLSPFRLMAERLMFVLVRCVRYRLNSLARLQLFAIFATCLIAVIGPLMSRRVSLGVVLIVLVTSLVSRPTLTVTRLLLREFRPMCCVT